MEVKINESWKKYLASEFENQYFKNLVDFVKDEYKNYVCYPKGNLIFSALDFCAFDEVKVVIIGQDPYHGANQANGLCFSVNEGVVFPPSLKNIFKELNDDLGIPIPNSGNLEKWAKQGVLLLNATLTVRAGLPGSHQNKGWETFTDSIIKALNDNRENIVFLLWGSYAQKKGEIINSTKHKVLKTTHPSPFSVYRGFLGCKHFSLSNEYLKKNSIAPVVW